MKRFLTLSNLRLAIEIVLVIAALAFTLARSNPTEAASASAPEAPDANYWYQCNSPYMVQFDYTNFRRARIIHFDPLVRSAHRTRFRPGLALLKPVPNLGGFRAIRVAVS